MQIKQVLWSSKTSGNGRRCELFGPFRYFSSLFSLFISFRKQCLRNITRFDILGRYEKISILGSTGFQNKHTYPDVFRCSLRLTHILSLQKMNFILFY